ncbi:MAG: hypothetical protein FWG89_04765 [Treponema sp.]|nr:hypothetical protein [Treponema sp.]
MKKIKIILTIFIIFLFHYSQFLFASGSKEEEEELILNDKWVLCITAFDYSHLPPLQRITGNVFTRDLVNRLDDISYRFRISHEYAYYESYAWQQSIRTIALQISQRQNERSNLLFEGLSERNYQTRLKTLDTTIANLYENLEEIESKAPLIHGEPSFELTQSNINGIFPDPPPPGTEYRFARNQNADGFLTGEIREFHGRYYLRIRLYTLHTNSFVHEDYIIFSLDDSAGAIDEIASQLVTVLSGNKPAAVAIQVEPEESQILINRNLAGRGTVEIRERPPGDITVAVAAEGYSPMIVETELLPDVLTEITIALGPLLYSDVFIDVPSENTVNIYHGAMYIGQAPLNLRVPINDLAYFVAETWDGDEAKAVIAAPDYLESGFNLSLNLRTPPPQGVQRVNRARRRSYWAWGGVWIAGLTAWITNGIFTGHTAVLAQSTSEEFWAQAETLNYIRLGALGLTGAALVNYFAFQMPRYLRTATEGSTPIVRQERANQ